jgi:hypothetical protein
MCFGAAPPCALPFAPQRQLPTPIVQTVNPANRKPRQAVEEKAAAQFRRVFDKYDWTKALAG